MNLDFSFSAQKTFISTAIKVSKNFPSVPCHVRDFLLA